MKKLVFLLVCVFTVSTVAMADNEKPIQVGDRLVFEDMAIY